MKLIGDIKQLQEMYLFFIKKLLLDYDSLSNLRFNNTTLLILIFVDAFITFAGKGIE